MEKIIELLNEYENRDEDQQIEWRIGEGDKGENGKVRGIVNDVYMGWVSELVVCSANYGFIKWLLDNEKIDRSKFYDKNILKGFMTLTKEEKADSIIMNLSINDEPINFLISILK